MKQKILLVLKGIAMGIAETIPGVSGGTIAFISGIYERLLNSIKAFGPHLVKSWREGGNAAVWKEIDGNFLVFLLSGMAVGIVIGLKAVSWLMINYPPLIWAFFFGLVVASIIYVVGQIKGWHVGTAAAFIIGALIAYGITLIPVGQTNESLWFVFLCGAVAVCAFILPGISGSFVLLILGMYQFILHDTLKDGVLAHQDPHSILIMATFGVGMVLGITSFSRALSWALKVHHKTTLSVLAGFMLGAISKLWPWRIPSRFMTESGEVLKFSGAEQLAEIDKVITEINVIPARYAAELGEPPYLIATIVSLVVGFVLVYYIDRKTKVKI